jgi:hypothetical protein
MYLMSIRQYAKHRGCALSSVQAALAAGRIAAEPDGKLDAARCDADWALNTDHTKPRATGPQPETFASARARREAAQAELAELELARRRGDLLDAREVARDAFNCARATRDALEHVAPRLAPHLLSLTDVGEAERIVREAIHGAIDGLVSTLEKPSPRRKGGKRADHAAA